MSASLNSRESKRRPVTPQVVAFSKATFDSLVLVDMQMSPSLAVLQSDVRETYVRRQTEALTEKFIGEHTMSEETRWQRTLSKFFQVEEHVRMTNQRFRRAEYNEDLIAEMQLEAFRVLPPVTDALLASVYRNSKPGPGSSVGRTGQQNALVEKLERFGTATHCARQHIPGFLQENPALASMFYGAETSAGYPCPRPALCDELFQAPKNAEIGRMCGKQSDFNCWIQMGIGHVMAGVLYSRLGVDIRDQSLGWGRAQQGSVDQSFATLDLSSASATVAVEFVRKILPPDWFALLDSVRHRYFRYREEDGSWSDPVRYEGFSSMGNGFTFPLESLLFALLVRAVSRRHGIPYDYAVYGDDIVVASVIAPTVVEELTSLGFILNPAKSFVTGPFRETCGKDFQSGEDVRPWYIKAAPVNEVECYILHNVIATHSRGRAFPRTLEYLRSLVLKPALQPYFYGAGENWWDWESFLVREYAFGFMVDVAEAPPTSYHRDWQAPVYRLAGFAYREDSLAIEESRNLVALSLYSGSSAVKAWRRGRYVSRKRTISSWHSLWG
jgi:hypothetical protein